jgi:hypothetical protein
MPRKFPGVLFLNPGDWPTSDSGRWRYFGIAFAGSPKRSDRTREPGAAPVRFHIAAWQDQGWARQGAMFRMADHFVSLKDLTPEERRLREMQRRSDAELAMKEHQEARRAFFENRDRLRALRLAREAEGQK